MSGSGQGLRGSGWSLGLGLGACFALSPPRSPSQPLQRRAMMQGEEVPEVCPQAPVTQ